MMKNIHKLLSIVIAFFVLVSFANGDDQMASYHGKQNAREATEMGDKAMKQGGNARESMETVNDAKAAFDIFDFTKYVGNTNGGKRRRTKSTKAPGIITFSTKAPGSSKSTKAPGTSKSTKAPGTSKGSKAPGSSKGGKAPGSSKSTKAPGSSKGAKSAKSTKAPSGTAPATSLSRSGTLSATTSSRAPTSKAPTSRRVEQRTSNILAELQDFDSNSNSVDQDSLKL